MRIKKMYIEGAYSFPVLDFDFTNHSGGVTIILGKNLDQQTNNGAGKSTILKCLYLLAYGKDLNGANVDDAISFNSPKGGFAGYLEFEDKGSNFRITRYRKAAPREDGIKLHDGKPVSGNGIEFMMDDMCLNGESDPQTQKTIENKLRVSPRLFLSSVLMAQNSSENFLDATDVKKKDLLSELLDLTEYAKAFETIKKEIKLTEDRLALIESKIESLQENIAGQSKRMTELSSQEILWAEENKKDLLTLESQKKDEEDKIEKILEQLKNTSESSKIEELKSSIKKIEEYLDSRYKKVEKENEILLQKSKSESAIESAKKEIQEKCLRIEKNKKEISSLKEGSHEEIALFDVSGLESKLKELNLKDSKIEIKESSDVLKEQLKNTHRQLESLSLEKANIEKELESTLKDSNCPTCKKGFQSGDPHFEEIKGKFQKQLNSKDNLLEELNESSSAIQENVSKVELIELEKKSLQKEISELETQIIEKRNENEKKEIILKQRTQSAQRILSIEEEIEFLNKNIEELNKSIKEQESKISKYLEYLSKIQELKSEIQKGEVKLKEVSEEFSKIEKTALILDQLKIDLEERESRVKTISESLTKKIESGNPYKKIRFQIMEDLKKEKATLKAKKESADEIQSQLKYLHFWKKGFAPTGIRSFISDDIIDILNMKTQHNLNYLFDGALTVLFDPETSSKKGSTSNKISTKFFLNGIETKKELLSGGELQRCILAVDLALTEIAESRSGIKLNLKFLDEPFNGIDASGQQKSLALFSKLAKKKDGFYIISHEEKFQNMCQNQIYILKKNGVSQFVERDAFDSISFNDEEADTFYQKQEAAAIEKSKRGPKKKFKSLSSLDNEDD